MNIFKSIFKQTPLPAAFFSSAFLVACSQAPEPQLLACEGAVTAISSVQGDGDVSPLLGQLVTIRGVTTLVEANSGFFIEEHGPDDNPATSNALFVHLEEPPEYITSGALITLQGRVTESGDGRDTLTSLADVSATTLCEQQSELPLTTARLPLDPSQRESLEAMRIRVEGPLTVTDVYQYGGGNITLSANGLQYVPTEVTSPGPEAAQLVNDNREHALAVSLPATRSVSDTLLTGVQVDQVSGVVAHDRRGQRIALETWTNEFAGSFDLPVAAPEGAARVVSMNLHNYFNGDGAGGGFPTPRGAETLEEFQLQRARIGAAIKVLQPDVLAVQELENDGYDANSAAQDFLRLANGATNSFWQVARPENDDTGGDRIRVSIFYREDRFKAIGPARTRSGDEFRKSRQPQAQLLEDLANGERLLVVVNHLKSKGSCPDSGENANQRDGQGCWNPMRTLSAEKMSAWVKAEAESAGTDNILILGDMNAYRNEDPIAAIRQAGFVELMESPEDMSNPVFTFVFYGQHGTLDYAFASESLREKVRHAQTWNVNTLLPANMPLPRPWLRFSDHDPVVVDIF
jgi:predicted extracellular nuclease